MQELDVYQLPHFLKCISCRPENFKKKAMLNRIKTIALFFAIAIIVTSTSCLNSDKEPPRTPEMEQEELNAALQQLIDEGNDIDTTELGVYYIVQEEGTGPNPQAGDTISLEYTGFLLDGTIFDASAYHYEDAIWKFVYKEIPLIPGFDEGIAMLSVGAEIDLIIPSYLAYGVYGNGAIGPYETLFFATKLHALNPKVE